MGLAVHVYQNSGCFRQATIVILGYYNIQDDNNTYMRYARIDS